MALIHNYVLQGDRENVAKLLAKNNCLESKTDLGFTPLLCAVQEGYVDIVRLLLKSGANIYVQSGWGNNCLHIAFIRVASKETGLEKKEDFYNIVKMILEKEKELRLNSLIGLQYSSLLETHNRVMNSYPLDTIDDGEEKRRILEIIDKVKNSSNNEQQDQADILSNEHDLNKKSASVLIHRRQRQGDNPLSSEKTVTDKTRLIDGNPKQTCIIL